MYELPPRPLEPPRLFRVGRGADHRGRWLEFDLDAVARCRWGGVLLTAAIYWPGACWSLVLVSAGLAVD